MDFVEIFSNSDDLVDFPSGTDIMREGEPGDCLFVLVEGEAIISLNRQPLGTIKAGEIIGEMALINSQKRSATVTAATNCRLAVINEASFASLLKHVPDFSLHLMRVLANRLQTAYTLIGHK